MTSVVIQIAGIAPTLLIIKANIDRDMGERGVVPDAPTVCTVAPMSRIEEEMVIDISRSHNEARF
ncbi:hypothetical protein PQX77_015074 [Marasmius sp. AFHP31]|nr:hypothetical protein PQX77_015074 [Marasmius sp. AFHP31]